MDQSRFEELKKKQESGEGLTEAEANELGRMLAEEQGEPYQNADDLREQQAEAEAEPASDQDKPAGARPPLGARNQESKTDG